MASYTIKLGDNSNIFLLNEKNETVSVLELLKECGDRRVLAFDGVMGAGKTTLIKQLVEEMGSTDVVNSPTFAIVNVYDVEQPYRGEVYHFDCYRLKNLRDALDLGAEEYLYSGNYCLVEWPEVLSPILPEDTVWLKIVPQENGDRRLEIEDQ